MAVAALLTVPAQLGLPQLATREISVSMTQGALDEAKGTLVWFTVSVLVASAIIAVTAAAIGIAWATAPNASLVRTYYWGLAGIPLFALCNLGIGMLRGYHRQVDAQLLDALLQPAIFAILLFVMIAVSARLDAAGAMAMRTIAAS